MFALLCASTVLHLSPWTFEVVAFFLVAGVQIMLRRSEVSAGSQSIGFVLGIYALLVELVLPFCFLCIGLFSAIPTHRIQVDHCSL